jgi:hypothetical protein
VGIRKFVPAVTGDSFLYPTDAFFVALGRSVTQICSDTGSEIQPKLLHLFVQSLFKKICVTVSVQGSRDTLDLEVKKLRTVSDTTAPLQRVVESEEHAKIMKHLATRTYSQVVRNPDPSHSAAAVSCTDPTPQPGHSENDQGVPEHEVEEVFGSFQVENAFV